VDYLSQLLGRTDEKFQSFAQDVGRFHQGEPLISIQDVEDDVKLPAVLPERTYDATKPKASSDRQENEALFPSKQTSEIASLPKVVVAKPPSKAASMPSTSSSTSVTTAAPTPNETTMPPPVISPPPPKSHPPKGTASVVCGCFGSVHKPLTNCLYCGRISCEKEGYDYCPFCGLLVEKVSGGYVLYGTLGCK
jgi:Putative zinc finger motif, C2HC5-type